MRFTIDQLSDNLLRQFSPVKSSQRLPNEERPKLASPVAEVASGKIPPTEKTSENQLDQSKPSIVKYVEDNQPTEIQKKKKRKKKPTR